MSTITLTIVCVALTAQSPADRSEAELLAVLRSDAGVFDKAKACQGLAVVGTAKSVPALAALLGDKALAHYARFALEPINDSSVSAALRKTLGELDGELLIGVINSLGVRRDRAALERLSALTKSTDGAVAAAAISAIGRVASVEAAGIVKATLGGENAKLREAAGQAGLACAETLLAEEQRAEAITLYDAVRRAKVPRHVRMAGLRGAILARGERGTRLLARRLKGEREPAFELALLVSREMPGAEVTQAMADTLGELEPERQALVITALGERGDRVALPAVRKALGGPEGVKVAAIDALRRVGDASVVPTLLDIAVDSESSEAARDASRATLAGIAGGEIDGALLAELDSASGDDATARRAVVLDVIGERRIHSAVPALKRLATAGDLDSSIRHAALRALGRTVSIEDLPFLIERVVKASSEEDGDVALGALDTACGTIPDANACAQTLAKALRGVAPETHCRLLSVFNSIGGEAALAIVASTAVARNAELGRCAVKVLGEWRSPEAADILLALGRGASSDAARSDAIVAVCSLIRRLGFPKEQRLARCGEAMEIARSVDERKTVIHAYEGIPAPETLAILRRYLKDEDIGESACVASITIAERLLRSRRSQAARALEAVIEAAKDEAIVAKARRLYKQGGGK